MISLLTPNLKHDIYIEQINVFRNLQYIFMIIGTCRIGSCFCIIVLHVIYSGIGWTDSEKSGCCGPVRLTGRNSLVQTKPVLHSIW